MELLSTKLDEIIWCFCHYFSMSIFIYFLYNVYDGWYHIHAVIMET